MTTEEASARRDLGALAEAMQLSLDEANAPRGRLLQLEELPLDNPWDPGVSELNLLARPFLELADLDDLDVFVELWEGDEKLRGLPDTRNTRPGHRPAVWFDTIDEGLCILGAEAGAVGDARRCISDMAHAVARAFWAARGVALPFPDREAELADVTAVRLGFGALMVAHPAVLSSHALLELLAEECRRGGLDVERLELALPPQWHPALMQRLTDA